MLLKMIVHNLLTFRGTEYPVGGHDYGLFCLHNRHFNRTPLFCTDID